MEQTTDVIDGVFSVAGGSGVLTDGTYYWRRDAADYVRTYGIGLEFEQLEHMRRSNWIAPRLTDEVILGIDGYLYGLLGASNNQDG